MTKTIHFIVNPISGRKKIKSLSEKIKKEISSEFEYEIHYTRHPGHGKVIAEYLSNEKAYMVVVVGGDGSVNEIGSALIKSDTLLGIIPTGSGNGFAHHFNIPENITKALKIIKHGAFKLSDVGQFENHYFLSNCGIGLDAVIAKEFSLYHTRGFASYVKLTLNQYFKFSPMSMTVKCNGKEIEINNALFISVANTSEFGNKFQIAPNNSHDDGLLELVVFKKPKLLILPFVLIRFFTKGIRKSKYVSHYQTEKVEISNIQIIQKDGDWIPDKIQSIQTSVIPKCLKVVC